MPQPLPLSNPMAQPDNQWRTVAEKSLLHQEWLLPIRDQKQIEKISEKFNVSETIADILTGFYQLPENKIENFLNPKIKNIMTDPNDIEGMEKGIALMIKIIQQSWHDKKPIILYGDYDVDGASSIAMLYHYLTAIKCPVKFYVPNRMTEGYGPNLKAMEKLLADGAENFIFLDCGTGAIDLLLDILRKENKHLNFIILDHHLSEALPPLPNNLALVNPNQHTNKNNYRYLCAAGVVLLFLTALQRQLRQEKLLEDLPSLMEYIDLVALATIADVVPLVDLNRAIVKNGLALMTEEKRLGIKTLHQISGGGQFNSGRLGFYLAPLINAGGRLGESALGATILTTQDKKIAEEGALQLYHLNEKRKTMEEEMSAHAEKLLANGINDNLIMVADKFFHIGVVGILASRLKEKYHRPTIVGHINGDNITASARSYSSVDIGAGIMAARQAGLLLDGGGHKKAGGFKCKTDKWYAVQEFIINHIQEQCGEKLPPARQKIAVALPLPALHVDLASALESLAPFGAGNPLPIIMVKDLLLEKASWLKDQHLSVVFANSGMKSKYLRTIIFRALQNPMAQHLSTAKRGSRFHIIGELHGNDWQGQRTIDFFLRDAVIADT